MRTKNLVKHGVELVVSDTGVITKSGKLMALNMNLGGYLRVCLNLKTIEGYKIKHLFVHQLVLEAFVGPKPTGMWCNHKDGVKTNNNLDNLEYCTPSQNLWHAAHCLRNGMIKRGREAVLARLPAEKIRATMALRGICSTRTAAVVIGISKSHVHSLWSGRTYTGDVLPELEL